MELTAISSQAISKKLKSIEILWQEKKRTADIYVPANLTKSSPMVLMLHGAGGNSLMAAKQTNWCEKADREGIICVFPNGLPFDSARQTSFLRNPQVWNSGVERGVARISDIDDVGFIASLIDHLLLKFPIDADQVFAAGFSNGGGMCWRLAIELSEKLARAAAVCAYLSVPEPWHQTRPVSLLVIACLDDPLVPIDGGFVKDIWSKAEISRPSVRISVEKYADLLGCPATPALLQTVPAVLQATYAPGNDGSAVEFYTVGDAGHAYPGGPPLLSERIAGKRTDALNATDVIWDFFRKSVSRQNQSKIGGPAHNAICQD